MSLAPARSTSFLGQGVCEDSPQLPTLTIILPVPDELLLEIFDAFRQHFRDRDDWNRSLAWFKLTHVCRRWRRIVFASFCRLDLCLVLTTRHNGHMKTILSPRLPALPITIDYSYSCSPPTPKDMSRLLSALKHHDRVRGISLTGVDRDFAKFFKETKRPFLTLESLQLDCRNDTLSFPAKFLGGSTPLLQRLDVDSVHFESISRILSSATALVELSLGMDTTFGPSPEVSLLAYLQAMPCLRSLKLKISRWSIDVLAHPTNVVTLSHLTRFRYSGRSAALNTLVGGLITPSLEDLCIILVEEITSPISHLPRFIDDLDKEYRSVQLAFGAMTFRISLLTDLEPIDCIEPRLRVYSQHSLDSLMRISNSLSARFVTAKELLITFERRGDTSWRDITPWRKFLWQFRSVKIIRLERSGILDIADCLEPASLDFLPSLEEIELRAHNITVRFTPDSEFEAELAAFQPFVLAREQAGRPVKVYRTITYGETWGFARSYGR